MSLPKEIISWWQLLLQLMTLMDLRVGLVSTVRRFQ